MPDLETALRTRILGDATIASEVGNRVRPLRSQTNATFPHITYQRVDTAREATHSGSTNYARPRIQYDVWAETYDAARDLALKVVHRMHGYRGVIGGVEIFGILSAGDTDTQEEPSGIYRASLDFYVHHREL